MQVWIDVENAGGVRYGDGPITTANDWTITRRLDGAGTFSFSMPASDPRANLLGHKRVVRCWGADVYGVRELGAGVIEQIEVTPGDVTMLRVSGDDLLRELANRSVGKLELFGPVDYSTTAAVEPLQISLVDQFGSVAQTLPATIDLRRWEWDPEYRGNFLYFSHVKTWNKLTITLTAVNTELTDTFRVQYYNAQDPDNPTWETVSGLVNNSAAPGPDTLPDAVYPFGVLGQTTIEFDQPMGWSPKDGLYTIRMFDQIRDLTPFTISAAFVTITEPVTDGLQRVMALAPPGWSLDPAGLYATSVPVYMQYQEESILQALVMLAQQAGDHFTLSAAGRRVRWIGTAGSSSGLRAVQATEISDETMAITSLRRVADSYDLCTRLYGYGTGTGGGRLTIETADDNFFAPNYIRNAEEGYIENQNATAIYGRIDRVEDFPDIKPVDPSRTQVAYAANTLLRRMYNMLRRRSGLNVAYDVEVAPGRFDVWPGQTVRVVYHEWVDGYHAVDIDADLWVLEISQRVTTDGVRLARLTVATSDEAPPSDAQMLAKLIRAVRQTRAVNQPASSYSVNRAGVPVTMAVLGGQITSMGRVNPVQDDYHNLADVLQIRTTNGIITAVIRDSGSSSGGSVFPPKPDPWDP